MSHSPLKIAYNMRNHILKMAAQQNGAHIGGSLSSADILAVLFFHVLSLRPDEPDWVGRDYFILSKGHASAAYYAVLAEKGFISTEELDTYCQPGSRLAGHPKKGLPGLEFPTGSLGHGLSLGAGTALALQRDGKANQVYVLMGDGELQEGSIWEAAMFAAHHKLGNLIGIVDKNKLQISGSTNEVMNIDPLIQKWEAFGWNVKEVDGHSIAELTETFDQLPLETDAPCLIIANTIKAKGISFMENNKKSHFVKFNAALYKKAHRELVTTGEEE
ncbi:transketolase [Paenibacillus campi]|uniref:transketolase n=1 Tax=Paenibacillus campi TaxID=3106031 RepID=UPI002AFF721F|nr:transketolase [Paenibacillus sp. SGZ-1014]